MLTVVKTSLRKDNSVAEQFVRVYDLTDVFVSTDLSELRRALVIETVKYLVTATIRQCGTSNDIRLETIQFIVDLKCKETDTKHLFYLINLLLDYAQQ